MKQKIIILVILASSFISFSPAKGQHDQTYYRSTDPLVLKNLEEWQDCKLGLLMHWGPYSQWGVVESWSICNEDEPWCFRGDNYEEYKQKYEKLPETFNPVNFDPALWAAVAEAAGMKYVVFTTKHHDGFCMFDTKETDYKITSSKLPFHSNPKADVTREIFRAFRDKGFKIGAYFSKPDWHSEYFWWPKFSTPDRNVNYSITKYPERWQKFVEYTHKQIGEICSNYGRVDILWLDGGWVRPRSKEELGFSAEVERMFREKGFTPLNFLQNMDVRMDLIAAEARKKQPGMLIVDRTVEGPYQDYLTPENQIPEKPLSGPWETCMTMHGGWSYNKNAVCRPAGELIHSLADVVAKGGNLLLNVGPSPEGEWLPGVFDRLREIGAWMKINSEAIYGTRGGKIYAEGNIRFTWAKDGTVYAIYLAGENEKSLPAEIVVPGSISEKEPKVRLLGNSAVLKCRKSGNGWLISVPESIWNHPPCNYAWVFKIS